MANAVLRNTGAALSQTFYADEVAVSADGTVTVTLSKSDGTVLSTGPATAAGTGRYSYVLAPQSTLDVLTLTWSGTFGGIAQSLTSTVEIVGGFYVALAEIRALPNMGDMVKFPTAELVAARQWFETTFEDYIGMAFVPRAATERIAGGRSTIRLKRWPVRSITAVRSFTTPTVSMVFTAAELADLQRLDTGEVKRYSLGYWPADVEVDYTHGQAGPPADVKRAALVAIQEKLMEDSSGRPTDRTYGTATDGVFVRSILPGKDKPFGLASVDEVAARYRAQYWVPAVA